MTKYYEEKALTSEQVKNMNLGARYFKAFLLSEDGDELEAVVGKYKDLRTAKTACRSYAYEEIDGGARFIVKEYYLVRWDNVSSKIYGKLRQVYYC